MKNRIIFIIIFLVIGLIIVFGITSPKNNTKVYTAFTNIKGKGVIDDKDPNYWNNKKYVYFKMYNYYYIAKLIDKKKDTYDYEMLYYLKKKEYKEYNYYLGTDNYLYLVSNNKITIYNLNNKEKYITKKYKNNIKLLGIDDYIYIKVNNKIYKYDEKIKVIEEVEEIPSNIIKPKLIK
jgi:hypothetical protein